MEREIFRSLNTDLRLGKINKKFVLSEQFDWVHKQFVLSSNKETHFNLEPSITVKRKDQLLLNLQYNNLLYGYNIYDYHDYCKYTEEFFTYFINYELTTGRVSPNFPKIIRNVFKILNKYTM